LHHNLGCVSWRIVAQEQNALSQFAPHSTRDLLTQTSEFVCIVRTVYGTTLLKKVIMIIPWPSQKIEAINFPVDGTLLKFFVGGEQGYFHPMLCFFWFWIEVMDRCFILSYDPVDIFRFILVEIKYILSSLVRLWS
jgi:hypothetical protein